MEAKNEPNVPGHDGVVDSATLYLCRQGERWVVVIESPAHPGVLRFHHAGRDPYDARFELLCSARRACPDAAIVSTDGALEDADYEWRLDIRGVEANRGRPRDGRAPRARRRSRHRTYGAASQRQNIRKCHWGRCPEVSGRPRSF